MMSSASIVGDAVVTSQLCFDVLKALNAVTLTKSHDKAVVELHRLRDQLEFLTVNLEPDGTSHVLRQERFLEDLRDALSRIGRNLRAIQDLLKQSGIRRTSFYIMRIELRLASQLRELAENRSRLDQFLLRVSLARQVRAQDIQSLGTLTIKSDKSSAEEHFRIRNWLTGMDQLVEHLYLTERYGESAGDWIQAEPKYREWLDSSNSFLWLSGHRMSSYPFIQ